MKKLLLITTVFFLTIQMSFSQEEKKKEDREIKFGVIASTSIHRFDNYYSFGDYTAKKGKRFDESSRYTLGFFLEKKVSNKFFIQSELLYSFGFESDFIEIPIILKYKFNKKFTFYSGVQLNHMLEPKNDYFKKTSFGFNAGVQYEFSKKWFLDVRYVHNFSQNLIPFDIMSDNQRSIRVGVGYRF
jgi:opacity protein-like surface antigen